MKKNPEHLILKKEETSSLRISLLAMRANFIPGLVLQAFALIVLLAYYYHPPTQKFLLAVAAVKAHWGLYYATIATTFFGGVLPFYYSRWITPKTIRPLSHFIFLLIFWAYKGAEVDTFYKYQAFVFGSDSTTLTLVKKVLVDQLIYCPFWSAPFSYLLYRWCDLDFSFMRLKAEMHKGYYSKNILPVLLSTWIVWFPTVTIIYCLPVALQVPLFNITLCFWVILFSHLAVKKK